MDNKCCICGKMYTGYGNNAEPFMRGRCCDLCNFLYVIPSRVSNVEVKEIKDETRKRTSKG